MGGERRGVSPPVGAFTGGLTPRRSPPRLFLTLGVQKGSGG